MAVVIFIILMLGLLVFIIWDRRRPVAPLSRDAMSRGWQESRISRWPVFAGFSAMAAALGIAEWFAPSHPPFSGRLSSVREVLYEIFGSRGFSYLLAALAVAFVVAAGVQWRSELAHRKDIHAAKR